jgi:hypothetical protein
MVVELRKNEEQRAEGVTLRASNNTWQSPPGGWLSVQSGSWDQTPRPVLV